jgi:hypothetical protein
MELKHDKRGMEMAISTIILLVIGIIVLIGLISIVVMGWKDFKTTIAAALGSDLAKAQRQCRIQCGMENTVDYCSDKMVNKETLKCTDPKLKPEDCTLTCSQVS